VLESEKNLKTLAPTPVLLCPVRDCHLALGREERRVVCARGHSFDIARSGYINVLLPQDRRSKQPGDTAAALFSLLNPINHASTRAGVYRYKVEPYVIAADVYAVPPHVGRGGWTWYTGSAGWMYRAGLESVLGLRLHADLLSFDPCIPRTWPGFTISLRHGSARYEIKLENPDGVSRGIEVATIDGEIIVDRPLSLTLADDAVTHRLVVRLGQSTSPPVAPRPGQASVPTGQKPVA